MNINYAPEPISDLDYTEEIERVSALIANPRIKFNLCERMREREVPYFDLSDCDGLPF